MHSCARITVWAFASLLAGCAATAGPGVPSAPSARAPEPDLPIALAAQCEQTEEDGFREHARLVVVDNQVRELSWKLWVGEKGGCTFKHEQFRQTRSRPSNELAERSGSACRLMVWRVPARVTLAHAGCEQQCSPGIYEEAWPVMFDPGTGGCATR